jgi:hypothetical protein
MTTYNYNIRVQATSKEEAEAKLKAICVLLDKLNQKEITKLAFVVANDPVKTKMAKIALGV